MTNVTAETEAHLRPFPFSSEVAARTAEWWSEVHDLTYTELEERVKVQRSVAYGEDSKGTQFLDVSPARGDSRPEHPIVEYAPMGVGHDPFTVYRLMSLCVLLDRRIIAVPNVDSPLSTGHLTLRGIGRVIHGDPMPLVEPLLRYLNAPNGYYGRIEHADHVGYSWGAHRASHALALMAEQGQHQVHKMGFVEPPGSISRDALTLADQFLRTLPAVKTYAELITSKEYTRLRKESVQAWKYLGAILAPTNLAIGWLIRGGQFGDNLAKALDAFPDAQATIYWGSRSELVPQDVVRDLITNLHARFGGHRIQGLELKGDRHAVSHDFRKYGAMVLQCLMPVQLPEPALALNDSLAASQTLGS